MEKLSFREMWERDEAWAKGFFYGFLSCGIIVYLLKLFNVCLRC